MLIKRAERQARRDNLAGALPDRLDEGVDRRSFLRRSGLAAGGLATLGALQLGSVRKAKAGPPPPAERDAHPPEECVHALFGWLFGHRGGRKWCVDRTGA